MSDLPAWALNPTDPDAATAIAADLTKSIGRRKLADAMSRDKDADPGDLAQMPRFQAELAYDTMQLTGQIQAAFDRSLNVQAASIIKDKLYLHTEYETAQEFFASALADTNRSISEASDLRFYAESVVPHMQQQGITGADKVWVKGKNVKKARAAKPALNKAFKELERARKLGDETATRQVEQIIDKIIGEVVDEKVTAEEFISHRHGSDLPPDMETMQGFKYVRGDGTVMVLIAMTEAQRIFVEESMGTFVDWHLGSNYEEIVKAVVRE